MSKSRENRNAVAIDKMRAELREWKRRIDNPGLRIGEVLNPLYSALQEFYDETVDLTEQERTDATS